MPFVNDGWHKRTAPLQCISLFLLPEMRNAAGAFCLCYAFTVKHILYLFDFIDLSTSRTDQMERNLGLK